MQSTLEDLRGLLLRGIGRSSPEVLIQGQELSLMWFGEDAKQNQELGVPPFSKNATQRLRNIQSWGVPGSFFVFLCNPPTPVERSTTALLKVELWKVDLSSSKLGFLIQSLESFCLGGKTRIVCVWGADRERKRRKFHPVPSSYKRATTGSVSCCHSVGKCNFLKSINFSRTRARLGNRIRNEYKE